MTDNEKRRMASAAPMQAAPQMMSQPMGMGAPAMGQPAMGGQLTNPTGMVGMPGMQPGFQEPSTVGTGLTNTTIGTDQVRAAMETLKKYKQGNSAVLTDAEVFGMAMHYYDEDITPPKAGTNCTVVMSKAELTPEDEEAIRKEARAAAEARIRNEEAEKIRRKRNAEEEAKERKEIAQKEEAYGKHIAPYLGLCFVAGDIEIRPLPTVMSVYEEGEAMHHCIYRMKYWQREDTLLMSARDKEGKRLESIEVNLRDYKVLQSRGLQNQPTEHHDTIVGLIKKNMNQIKRIRKAIRLTRQSSSDMWARIPKSDTQETQRMERR